MRGYKAELRVTGASPDEAWCLIRDHHYSGRMPSNIQHVYALRDGGGLFGDYGDAQAVAVFCIPPTRWSENVLELARLVRRPDCAVPLSRLLAESAVWLKRAGHVLLVSFADWTQSHHGGVYQASGWNYDGIRERTMDGLVIDGVFRPGRSCNSVFGTRSPDKLRQLLPGRSIEPHYDAGKHLYWKPLSVAGKTRAKRLGMKSLPYPKPNNAACPADECAASACEPGATPGGRSINLFADAANG
jgi:hypothetical protein